MLYIRHSFLWHSRQSADKLDATAVCMNFYSLLQYFELQCLKINFAGETFSFICAVFLTLQFDFLVPIKVQMLVNITSCVCSILVKQFGKEYIDEQNKCDILMV